MYKIIDDTEANVKIGVFGRILKFCLRLSWKLIKRLGLTSRLSTIISQVIDDAGVTTTNRIFTNIEKMTKGSKTIIIGPWISEVGFELLYWVPFLNWAVKKYNLDKDRLIVVSRGGADLWYGAVSSYKPIEYIDVFDYFTQEGFKQKNYKRIINGMQKHTSISSFDDEIIAMVKRHSKIDEFHWFHPSIMYILFHNYWRKTSSIALVDRCTVYKKFKPVESRDIVEKLPKEYIAVKFYFSPTFPDTVENREFIHELIENLSSRYNVVMLNTGLDIDDHEDCSLQAKKNVYNVQHLIMPRNNLSIQTQVISNASLFIGTYGGFSYLPPFYGVPSIALYSREDKFLPVHLDVAYRAFREIKFGSFDKHESVKESPRGNPNKYQSDFMALNIHNFNILKTIINGENLYAINLQRSK